MKTYQRSRLLGCLTLLAYMSLGAPELVAQPGYRAGKATPLQVMSLPKFCWWEFDARYAATQNLIQNCGPYMNHYCEAEVFFLRSKDVSLSKQARFENLSRALRETEYTLKGMKGFPSCSIRRHVTNKYAQIRSSFIGFGQPMPPNMLAGPYNSL